MPRRRRHGPGGRESRTVGCSSPLRTAPSSARPSCIQISRLPDPMWQTFAVPTGLSRPAAPCASSRPAHVAWCHPIRTAVVPGADFLLIHGAPTLAPALRCCARTVPDMTWVWKLLPIVIDQFPAPSRSRLPRPTDRRAWRHAETDLRHEPDPGRLHRRARRRPRLERAERRAVSVVARPGVGDRAVDVRAQAVGGDEFPLADRRPAARRHPGADRVRAELAGHAEGGVLLDD